MKLDRNINADGMGKYALLKLRNLRRGDPAVDAALRTLDEAGILDWGNTVDSEFFVIRLKDVNAANALFAYGSGPHHPHCKQPD